MSHRMRLLLLMNVVGLADCTPGPSSGLPAERPYACGNFSAGHCYAQASFSSRPTGARTTITIANHFVPGDAFVSNELWLRNISGNDGWLEVGYRTDRVLGLQYFWGKLDPSNSVFWKEDLGTIPAAEIGTQVMFDIHQTGPNSFLVTIDGAVTHVTRTVSIPLWSGNAGGSVQIGMELAGTQGVAASLATFTQTQFYDAQFVRRPLTSHERVAAVTNRPPFGEWLEVPRTGNNGGTFVTFCCRP